MYVQAIGKCSCLVYLNYVPVPVVGMDPLGPAMGKDKGLVPLLPQPKGLLLLLLGVVRLPLVISGPQLRYYSYYFILFSNSLF